MPAVCFILTLRIYWCLKLCCLAWRADEDPERWVYNIKFERAQSATTIR